MPPKLALNSAFVFDQDDRFLLPISLPPVHVLRCDFGYKKAA